MTKNKNLFVVASLALFILTSCSAQTERTTLETSEATEIATEENTNAETISINTEESLVTWNGYKSLLDTTHEGTIRISEGEFLVENNQLVGGNFTLDITTLDNSDLEGGMKEGLLNHLNSEEFFNTAEYTEGKFQITKVTPIQENGATHQISGNLTIKDITKNITFKSNIEGLDSTSITATSDFNIDRHDWELGHSNEPSILDQVKDNALKDEVRIRLEIKS